MNIEVSAASHTNLPTNLNQDLLYTPLLQLPVLSVQKILDIYELAKQKCCCNVNQLQREVLKKEYDLTINFDGGGTRRRESFYTVHVTTSNRRKFAWIYTLVRMNHILQSGLPGMLLFYSICLPSDIDCANLNHIQAIGEGHLSGVVSDSTGNTKKDRRERCKLLPTIINLPDPVHHTNLTSKILQH
jgi:hypothetical protein